MRSKDEIAVVTYSLNSTIRNKILNYKETVNSIIVDEDVSFTLNSEPCDCENSSFCDPNHKHIITGDLRIVENTKLGKLLSKGPNYREPRSFNFTKASKAIETALEDCIKRLEQKTK